MKNSPKSPTTETNSTTEASITAKTEPSTSTSPLVIKQSPTVNNTSNESFELNMSSVSAHRDSLTPRSAEKKNTALNKSPDFIPHDSTTSPIKGLSRTDSASSLFSHISSVSQLYEKDTPSKKRGRPPKKLMPRLMDDNELSVKKASEEALDAKNSVKSRIIQRRKSDLSSSSSSAASAASTANIEAVARLRANMSKIPDTLGSNDQEVIYLFNNPIQSRKLFLYSVILGKKR